VPLNALLKDTQSPRVEHGLDVRPKDSSLCCLRRGHLSFEEVSVRRFCVR
jgi:hypothetical protein